MNKKEKTDRELLEDTNFKVTVVFILAIGAFGGVVLAFLNKIFL